MALADRIAIMSEGVLQQAGTPAEVYEHPTNLFVAQFVGSPIMNVVDCQVEAAEAGMLMRLAGMAEPFVLGPRASATLREATNGELALGIRPEAIAVSRAAAAGAVPAHVHLIEPMGAYDIVDIAMGHAAGSATLRARTASQFVRRQGDAVWVSLSDARTHFFDKRSGLLLQADR
jgi:multiple sugar transport system ATP-binding protein